MAPPRNELLVTQYGSFDSDKRPTASSLADRARVTSSRVIQQLLKDNSSEIKFAATFDLVTPQELLDLVEYLLAHVYCAKYAQPIVHLQAPVKVFGDIHGQVYDLMNFFTVYGKPTSLHGDIDYASYLFLGDYVDRGANSLEVVTLLLSLRATYGDRIILLRGNHEDAELNIAFGFFEECQKRLPPALAKPIWERINTLFSWLPLAAVINETVLCVHGGIGRVETIGQIAAIKLPLNGIQTSESWIERDLMWSDPTENEHMEGIHESPRGSNMVTFGPDVVRRFCDRNGLSHILRAHQVMQSGYTSFALGQLVTVFSAVNYCGQQGNSGAILSVSLQSPHVPGSGKKLAIRPKVLQPPAAAATPPLQPHLSPVEGRVHMHPFSHISVADPAQAKVIEYIATGLGRDMAANNFPPMWEQETAEMFAASVRAASAGPQFELSEAGFHAFVRQHAMRAGAARQPVNLLLDNGQYWHRVFMALDNGGRGAIDCATFQLAIAAMDIRSPHGPWLAAAPADAGAAEAHLHSMAAVRMFFIFRMYASDPQKTAMTLDDFAAMIGDISKVLGKPLVAAEVASRVRAKGDKLRFADLLNEVSSGTVRGTSSLFRLGFVLPM